MTVILLSVDWDVMNQLKIKALPYGRLLIICLPSFFNKESDHVSFIETTA